VNGIRRAVVQRVREYDRRFSRRGDRRHVLVDSRTPVNYVMVAPLVRAMADDPRVQFFFTASEEPARMHSIYADAGSLALIHPLRAATMKFDAYLASDFMWAKLLRETCRVQTFHGVGGKYGFDAPTESMREWHRLFFVNRRRLNNYIKHGAIDPDSPAIRLIGYPKTDCLLDGTLKRTPVLHSLGLDPAQHTILYAPTWSPASSLNAMGEDVVRGLLSLGANVIVKLHDRSRDLRERYSGGVDWVERLRPLLPPGRGVLAPGHDISPYLAAADVMITDHSSAGFEFLLLDRPIVRIHRPALLKIANVHPDYAELLASVSETVENARGVVDAVVRAIADPRARSAHRRAVAEDLFYLPGTATARAINALYEAIELDPLMAAVPLQEARCQQSV
jgi:CDP-glycerol glycerophosphotransferase (TagB/SpsB family)